MISKFAALSLLCGSALGVVVGVAQGNLPIWIALGTGAGLVLALGFSPGARAPS